MLSNSVIGDNPFPEFSHVHGHGEFIQLIVAAKAMADINQKTVPVTWRGYDVSIQPNLPTFSREDYRTYIQNAITALNLKV